MTRRAFYQQPVKKLRGTAARLTQQKDSDLLDAEVEAILEGMATPVKGSPRPKVKPGGGGQSPVAIAPANGVATQQPVTAMLTPSSPTPPPPGPSPGLTTSSIFCVSFL